MESLSWGDAVFLYLERDGAPLHIASLSIFAGRLPLAATRRLIASKLPLIPRYRQRVVTAPFNIGLPTWEYDPQFDIRRHVREMKLRRGTLGEVQSAAGKILTQRMDRRHPLWDFTLLPLAGNRTAILARVHHCLADGIAGVGIMNVLMDPTPIAHRLPRRPRAFRPPPPKDELTLLLDGWVSTSADLVQRLLSAQDQAVNLAQRVAAARGRWPAGQFLRLLPELGAATEPLRFNVVCRGPQKFVWAEVPLSDVKAVKQAWGGTVNDVILTLVTATIRRYLQAHGDGVSGRLFRMMVPVNVRGGDNARDLGNRISLLPVTIPLGTRNPRRLLAAVHRRMEFLKNAHIAEIVGLAGGLIGVVPTALQALAGPLASGLPITPFNLVCTNVPGPQLPLYLLGHKMLSWYPYVPVGGQMALNCAALSYNGVIYFGFSGDAHAVPDLPRLKGLLQASFAEMLSCAGGAPQTKQRQSAPQAKERAPLASPARVRKPRPAAPKKGHRAPGANGEPRSAAVAGKPPAQPEPTTPVATPEPPAAKVAAVVSMPAAATGLPRSA